MFKQAKLALAALAVLGVTSAVASPFYIDTGVDAAFTANGSTRTDNIDQLGYTRTLATSFYLGNPNTPGTAVIDTNVAATMIANGFSAGNHVTLGGPIVTHSFPADPAQVNIGELNDPFDNNGFTNGVSLGFLYGNQATSGAGTGFWGLTYQYELYGVTFDNTGDGVSDGVSYTSGFFDVYYQDCGPTTLAACGAHDNQKVARLLVTGSDLQVANLNIFGTFDYGVGSGVNAADPFVQNFFNAPDGSSFYSKWLTNPNAVSWILDTNVDPPVPTLDQLVVGSGGQLIRQSTLDGSVIFNVPEPGSLALIGLALAGLGVASRRARKS